VNNRDSRDGDIGDTRKVPRSKEPQNGDQGYGARSARRGMPPHNSDDIDFGYVENFGEEVFNLQPGDKIEESTVDPEFTTIVFDAEDPSDAFSEPEEFLDADDPLDVDEIDRSMLSPDKPIRRRKTRAEKKGVLTDREKLKVIYDFDGKYPSLPTENPLRGRREKRTGCVGGILFAVFVICVSVVLAVVLWFGATDVLALGKQQRAVTVVVPRGFDVDYITDMLYDNDLIKYKGLFKLYTKFSSGFDNIVPGQYLLDGQYDYRALINGMTKRGAVRVTKDIVFPEGMTADEIFQKLENEGVCFADELWAAAQNTDFDYDFLESAPPVGEKLRLEGFLFPDTYTFYVNDTPERVLGKFLDAFNARVTNELRSSAEETGHTLLEILTIASMIEREAGSDTDRPLIASVIENRLNIGQPLQIDATIYYAMWLEGIPTSGFSTTIDNPYNTYRAAALPPGPIASPGLKSIKAAIEPAQSNYFYYALHKDGEHKFFETYAEQQEFIRSDEYARS